MNWQRVLRVIRSEAFEQALACVVALAIIAWVVLVGTVVALLG